MKKRRRRKLPERLGALLLAFALVFTLVVQDASIVVNAESDAVVTEDEISDEITAADDEDDMDDTDGDDTDADDTDDTDADDTDGTDADDTDGDDTDDTDADDTDADDTDDTDADDTDGDETDDTDDTDDDDDTVPSLDVELNNDSASYSITMGSSVSTYQLNAKNTNTGMTASNPRDVSAESDTEGLVTVSTEDTTVTVTKADGSVSGLATVTVTGTIGGFMGMGGTSYSKTVSVTVIQTLDISELDYDTDDVYDGNNKITLTADLSAAGYTVYLNGVEATDLTVELSATTSSANAGETTATASSGASVEIIGTVDGEEVDLTAYFELTDVTSETDEDGETTYTYSGSNITADVTIDYRPIYVYVTGSASAAYVTPLTDEDYSLASWLEDAESEIDEENELSVEAYYTEVQDGGMQYYTSYGAIDSDENSGLTEDDLNSYYDIDDLLDNGGSDSVSWTYTLSEDGTYAVGTVEDVIGIEFTEVTETTTDEDGNETTTTTTQNIVLENYILVFDEEDGCGDLTVTQEVVEEDKTLWSAVEIDTDSSTNVYVEETTETDDDGNETTSTKYWVGSSSIVKLTVSESLQSYYDTVYATAEGQLSVSSYSYTSGGITDLGSLSTSVYLALSSNSAQRTTASSTEESVANSIPTGILYVDDENPTVSFTDEDITSLDEDGEVTADRTLAGNSTTTTVSFTVSDGSGSGVDSAYYYLLSTSVGTDAASITSAVSALSDSDWTSVELSDSCSGTVTYSTSSDVTYLVIVKAYDNVGNVYTIASNGIVIDTTDPELSGSVDDDKSQKSDENVYGVGEADIAYTLTFYDKVVNSTASGMASISVTVTRDGVDDEEGEAYEDSFTLDLAGVSENENLEITTVTDSSGTYTKYILTGTVTVSSSDGSQSISISATATDNVGNSKTITVASGLQTDPVGPEVAVTSDIAPDGIYNTRQEMTITVTERDYDESASYLVIEIDDKELTFYLGNTQNKGNQGSSSDSTLTLDDLNEYDISYQKSESKSGDEKATVYVLTFGADDEDHDYNVEQIYVKDKAGNSTSYTESLTAIGEDEDAEELGYSYTGCEGTFTVDMVAPVIEVTYEPEEVDASESSSKGSGDYYFTNDAVTVTVTITERNFSKDGAVVTVNGEAVSDVEWTTDEEDEEEHTATFTYSAEGDYTFTVSCEDEAGNEAETYDTHYFTIDTTAPSTDPDEDDEPDIVISTEAFAYGYYNAEDGVVFTIAVTDPENSSTYSGIASVEYTIYCNSDGSDYDNNDITASGSFSVSGYQKSYTTDSVTINSSKNNSNYVQISVKVTDNAGNTSTATKNLVIDVTDPTVSVEYSDSSIDASTDSGSSSYAYVTGTVTATVTIAERNFDESLVDVTITYEDGTVEDASTYMTSSWAAGESNSSSYVSDSDTYTAVYTFTADGDYSFDVSCTDKANNESADYTARIFTIDNTPPVVSIAYYTLNSDGSVNYEDQISVGSSRVYEDEEVAAVITVTERNFDSDLVTISLSGSGSDGEEETLDASDYAGSWSSSGYVRTLVLTLSDDYNYTLSASCEDLAGNSGSSATGYVTVDTEAPYGTLTLTDGGNSWSTLYETVIYSIFRKETQTLTLTYDDDTSGVASVQYLKYTGDNIGSFRNYDYDDLEEITSGWKTYENGITMAADSQAVIYVKITDKSGNVTYINTEQGIVVEDTNPTATITINTATPSNGIYNSDVSFTMSFTDPITDTYSGLSSAYYEIYKDGVLTYSNESSPYTWTATSRVTADAKTATVSSNSNNSNDVTIVVYVTDNSGNTYSTSQDLSIDITDPTITVTYDTYDASNGSYYNTTRTATVTITERNFDASSTNLVWTNTDGSSPTISGWTHSGSGDSMTHTCTVTFSADGDYTFTVNTTDLAGNSSDYTTVDEFTIDLTDPVITVTYDNNDAFMDGYYNAARTATITVTEHNFNSSDFVATVNGTVQTLSWSKNGDVYTATITFSTDGDYTFSVSYTDLAGNTAETPTYETEFTIDLTAPTVTITGVEDQSANNDEVIVYITYTDTNFVDFEGSITDYVTLTLYGAKNGEVEVNIASWTIVDDGIMITLEDFDWTEAADDIYTLTVIVYDMAGNATEETVTFSINRYGSNYVLSDDTDEFVTAYYSNEEEDIVISEYNCNELVEYGVYITLGGTRSNLTEGEDYSVRQTGGSGQWYVYTYTIDADVFTEEGTYSVVVYSEDTAGNEMDNKTWGDESADIDFVIDKTAPEVRISGVEDGETYKSESEEAILIAEDNVALDYIVLYHDDEVVDDEDPDLIYNDDGTISYMLYSASDWQELKVVAVDKAGNQSEVVAAEVLVTTSTWVLFLNWLSNWWWIILLIIILILLIIFLILWKRRKNEEEEEGTPETSAQG